MTGERVGNWVLGAELGRGPMGVVYTAYGADDPLRAAAVKLLTHDSTRTTDFLAKFPAEVLALHRLNHPNIVKYYDAGVHQGQAWYATELVDGTDCATLLKTRPKKPGEPGLSWHDEVLSIAVQAARALKHGHHRSILHRHLKPSNFLLAKDGTLKVADFGIGKSFNLTPLALPADPFGTAGFLAPEHFTGKPLTRRSDLYSLGGVLYTLLAGRPPFTATTTAEFLHKHCYMLPDRPAHFLPDLPPDFDDLICELLAKDPARRPATAASVLEVLGQLRGKLERKGKKVVWPPDPGDASGLLPVLTEADEKRRESGEYARPQPLMSRPVVVIPLFLLVIAAALAVIFWPRPSPEELYAAAQPLIRSDNPADWDRALDEYLGPLADRYPDWEPKKVEADRTRLRDRKELRRAMRAAGRAEAGSEAERLYRRGLALLELGDVGGAKRTWGELTRAFADVPAEDRWVRLAAEGFDELAKNPPTRKDRPAPDRRTLDAAVERAKRLGAEGKPAEATAVLDALDDLYRDDPEALAVIRAAR